MAEGRSNAAIAQELVVSDAAVAKLDLGVDDSGHKRVRASQRSEGNG